MLFRSIKLFLSAWVFLHDWLLNRFKRLCGLHVSGTCVFLNYHTVTASTRNKFAAQMAMISRLTQPLPALRRQKLTDGVHFAAVTFDDAFRSFVANAMPVLVHFGVPAILFVPTGYLGRKSNWFDYGGENQVGEEVISPGELLALVNGGGLEIGSHSVTHRNLVHLDAGEARTELRNSKALLESILDRKIHSVSFPYGSFGDRELRLAREEGYSFCLSVAPHSVVSEIREGLIGRVSVQPSDWAIEFRLKLLGAYRWLPWAGAWKHKIWRIVAAQEWLRKTQTHA